MKSIEQIALEVAQEMGLIANSVYEAFAKQVLAAYKRVCDDFLKEQNCE